MVAARSAQRLISRDRLLCERHTHGQPSRARRGDRNRAGMTLENGVGQAGQGNGVGERRSGALCCNIYTESIYAAIAYVGLESKSASGLIHPVKAYGA